MTELVGREEELELLLRRWSKAKTGEGQVVLLSGEAGIGKSRLTAALLERLAAEPHTRLRYFCSPQHTDSALYPVIGQMERAAGFAHDDTAQTKLDKLDAVLAQTSTSKQDAALFAEMLSLPNDGRYPALDLTPEQRRQRTLEALVSQDGSAVAAKSSADDLRGCPLVRPHQLGMWGKAGQRSLQRSALIEAAEQLTRALAQIATLPATPALRREQINLQVALITPLIHIKGFAAPETKAAAERALLLIEQTEALGEALEDPLTFISCLFTAFGPRTS